MKGFNLEACCLPAPCRQPSAPAEEDGLTDFVNCLDYVDIARASFRTVIDRATGEDSADISHLVEPFLSCLVARVKDKAVGLDDCGGCDVLLVSPKSGARSTAGTASDASRRFLKTLAFLRGLQALGDRRRRFTDQEGLDGIIFIVEEAHIDHQVLDDRKAAHGFDRECFSRLGCHLL